MIFFKAKEEDKFEHVTGTFISEIRNSATATNVYSSPKGIPLSSTKHNLSASRSNVRFYKYCISRRN